MLANPPLERPLNANNNNNNNNKAGEVARCELYGKFGTIKNAAQHRCRGFHISHDLQLLIDSGDAGALAALSDHTADTDGWDDEFLPGYASGASDDGDLF